MASARAGFTELMYRAFAGGCEVTIGELIQAVSFDSGDYLDQMVELNQFLNASHLELRPPISSGEQSDVRQLLYADRARSFIEALREYIVLGEQSRVEYKSTFFVSVNRVREEGSGGARLDEDVVMSALKAICGYLNKDGGEIFFGVEPNKNICGIDLDFSALSHRNRDFDGWVNRVFDLIDARFHEAHLVKNYVDIDMQVIDQVQVVRILVRPREKISFVKDTGGIYHCYVRTSARIREIPIQDILDFSASRSITQ